jgi:excisionase family DNA binding protein
MTVQEAAAFLRISRSSLYTQMDDGELEYVKLGRSRRVPRRAVLDLAARGLRGGNRSERLSVTAGDLGGCDESR